MPKSRDSWLAIGLFAFMALITIVAAVQQVRSQIVDPPLSSFSTQADGALGLFRWLDEIGFSVSDTVDSTFAIPENSDLVFILEPVETITEPEWVLIDAWVEGGGTLIVAGRSLSSSSAYVHYDVVLRSLFVDGTPVVNTPLTTQPIVLDLPTIEGLRYLDTSRTDLVPLVTVNGRPTMLTFPEGEGRVILSTMSDLFSNYGLQQPGHAELLLNLLGETGGVVWFDEWHHGLRNEQGPSNNWLQHTPIGRSILYTIAVLFVWLILRGRNFGRPVPLRKDIVRRSPLEYVTAVANLSRRAGHRRAVLRDTHDRLKRDLGFRYRISPSLPDDEFVEALANYKPTLDKPQLLQLLRRLNQRDVNETELIQVVREATEYKM